MQHNLTKAFLNVVLAALVFLSVGFTLLVIKREPEVPDATAAAVQDNTNLRKVNAILNDVAAYNATARDPELATILQNARQTSTAH